ADARGQRRGATDVVQRDLRRLHGLVASAPVLHSGVPCRAPLDVDQMPPRKVAKMAAAMAEPAGDGSRAGFAPCDTRPMRHYDVFNGDADGICSLHQLRLADPLDSELVTGLKRDIALLDSVPARSGDVVTVLDVSLDRNRAGLLALLDRGVHVRYFDHHHAGDIPRHPRLEAAIDVSRDACTSALVDRHLGGRFRAWAVVGAFGDDLAPLALEL